MAKISARGATELVKVTTDMVFEGEYTLRQYWVIRTDGAVLNRIVKSTETNGRVTRHNSGYKRAVFQFKAERFNPSTAPGLLRDYLERRGWTIVE